jgi:hypothetical protein
MWSKQNNSVQAAMELAARFGIRVGFYDLKPPLQGFLIRGKRAHKIGIAHYIKNDPVLLKCVLLEELGHHLTLTQDKLRPGVPIFSVAGREGYAPLEDQALRWVAVQCVKEIEIRWFIDDGGGTLVEFARRFGVTSEVAQARCDALKANNYGLWQRLMAAMIDREAGFDTGSCFSPRRFHFEKYQQMRVLG